MITTVLIVTGVTLISYAFYKWVTAKHTFFETCNLPTAKPNFLFGNVLGFFLGKYSGPEFISLIYNKFPSARIFGMFDFCQPMFVVRDPDLIKHIFVKDFDHFEDHRPFVDEENDVLLGNSLFFLKGEKWRAMRATLSPAFTGSKMRQMFELVSECADGMAKYLLNETRNSEYINRDIKDVFSRYTNDVIATCAFGIQTNSFTNTENEFLLAGKKFMAFTGLLTAIKIILFKLVPGVLRAFKITILDKNVVKFFRSMIFDTMKIRKSKNIIRPDMINILMQVRQGNYQKREDEQHINGDDGFATTEESDIGKAIVQRTWNDDEIAAQCFLFFLAGFETTSTAMTFAAYELAVNSNVQEQLYVEIKETNELFKEKHVSYDALQKMKYLDQVVSESLRKWPPAVLVDRVCVKNYKFDDGEHLQFSIEKGTNLWIPIYGLHHDPKYFPNPDKFDPERFSDNNKQNINLSTYLPFGTGPRNCIGSRFALMEIKAMLYYLLLNFSIEPNSETQIPLRLKKTPVGLALEHELNLTFKKRAK